jgi:hypothetical protein
MKTAQMLMSPPMAETDEFKQWVRLEASRITGETARIKQKVEREMKHDKTERKDENGRWVKWEAAPSGVEEEGEK